MVVNVSIDERDSLVIIGMLDQNKKVKNQPIAAKSRVFCYP